MWFYLYKISIKQSFPVLTLINDELYIYNIHLSPQKIIQGRDYFSAYFMKLEMTNISPHMLHRL